ncbi:MAG: hypothetical protein WCG66_06120 [bacterium]
MIASREKPESARPKIFTPGIRLRMAATIFSNASTVPAPTSLSLQRNSIAHNGTGPQSTQRSQRMSSLRFDVVDFCDIKQQLRLFL